MKRLISIVALLAVATPAFAATKAPRPSHITRTSDGSYDVTYNYTDKANSGWYAAARAELSLLNWKNKYYSDIPLNEEEDHDDFSFEPVFSANLAFGKRINYFWRAEAEVGYITRFTDEDEGYEFALSTPYLLANGYYDFSNGLYIGAGVGIALPTTTLDAVRFTDDGNRKKVGVSPMGALMAGYSYKLDDSLVLDLRYRIAGFYGTTQKRELDGDHYFKNKIGLVLDNSISVGLRYEF